MRQNTKLWDIGKYLVFSRIVIYSRNLSFLFNLYKIYYRFITRKLKISFQRILMRSDTERDSNDPSVIAAILRFPFPASIKAYVKDDDFPTLINSTCSESNFRECLAADGRTMWGWCALDRHFSPSKSESLHGEHSNTVWWV